MFRLSQQDFRHFAQSLVGHEVEVITTQGTHRGTLLSVGTDSIVLRTRINGRLVRMIIRIALIIALFRLILGTRGRLPVWTQSHERDDHSREFSDDHDNE